jgi:hypothetical protein
MMDANATMEKDWTFKRFLNNCALRDLHHKDPATSTYIGSSTRRIDFIFGTTRVEKAIKAAGTLSYLDGPQADHRGLYIDVDVKELLGQSQTSLVLPPPRLRRHLKSNNPELAQLYVAHMKHYYEDHNMRSRLQEIEDHAEQTSYTDLKENLEAWDRDQGRAMKSAEKSLRKRNPKFQWSPELRNAGLKCRYWGICLREEVHQEVHPFSKARIRDMITRYEPTYQYDDEHEHSNSTRFAFYTAKLKQARTDLRNKQKEAQELRYRCYQDLLATYSADNDPDTQKDSLRKAKIVTNTIRHERCRAMFQKIRNAVRQQGQRLQGLTTILVPSQIGSLMTTTTDTNIHKLLLTTSKDQLTWTPIINPTELERFLLSTDMGKIVILLWRFTKLRKVLMAHDVLAVGERSTSHEVT